MKQYQIKNRIGSGNFSTVYIAQDLNTQSLYALKIMKTHPKIAAKQAHFLNQMKHPNIIKLLQFQQNEHESKLLLEYIGINTLQLYQSHSFGLKEEQAKCILFQTALGLAHMHSFGIIHRDIKPENLLIDKKNALVKVIDFGLAINSSKISTDYIATRWYRAPENLLSTKQYSTAIDVFSLGCVIVQLYMGNPLFPGSNNIDQLNKIFQILGEPTEQNWPKGYKKMTQLGIKSSQASKQRKGLSSILNSCNQKLIDLIEKMLIVNPKDRITCEGIVKHEYFKDIKSIIPPVVFQQYENDFLKNNPLMFKGFHQLKTTKTSLKHINKPIYQKHKSHNSQQFFRKDKITSIDSIKNNLNPSIIKSVGSMDDSLNYCPRIRLKTKDEESFLDNGKKISLNQDKTIKKDSWMANGSRDSKEKLQLKRNMHSKNSTEDTNYHIHSKLQQSFEGFPKQTDFRDKRNLMPGFQKPIIRTNRSPNYLEQIKSLDIHKQTKNLPSRYFGGMSPGFNSNHFDRKKPPQYVNIHCSPIHSPMSLHLQEKKNIVNQNEQKPQPNVSPNYVRYSNMALNSERAPLNSYRSYDNLNRIIGDNKKSPEIPRNYQLNLNKFPVHKNRYD